MEQIRVQLGERSYTIRIEAGSLAGVGSFAAAACSGKVGKVCVATTETVAGLYLETVVNSLERAGFTTIPFIAPDGEEHKTLAMFERIITTLIENRFERSSLMLPLGGGVIGDTAGFAAAAFLRGIPFIQVPTTIVAQIDSSIGGKVAVNHPLGKNLIGHFYQPLGVFADTCVLNTLESREVVSGMGEVVKHAVIRDEAFFTFLEEETEDIMAFRAPDDVMERFIASNCRIKADIVSRDEREGGVRALLNYGHTVGHAVEAVTEYKRFRHGEAVILGMLAAGKIAARKGLIGDKELDRQNRLLAKVGISRDVDGIFVEDLLEAMTHDKKVTDGNIRFILPHAIGEAGIHDDVRQADIEDGMNYMLEYAGL